MVQDAKLNLIAQKLKTGRLLGPYTHLEKRVSGVRLPPRLGAPEMSKCRKLLLSCTVGSCTFPPRVTHEPIRKAFELRFLLMGTLFKIKKGLGSSLNAASQIFQRGDKYAPTSQTTVPPNL